MSVLIKNESVINLSINASVASQASLSGLKDNDWNITLSESKQIKNKNNNEIISFIYNFFLIILAFIILIAIKLIIKKFKNDYQVLIFLREYNLIYFYNHFYFNNKIVIENENNKNIIYNLLEIEILNKTNYNSYKFFQFYNQYYSNLLNEFHSSYFKNYIKKITESSNIFKSINKPINSLLINGKYVNLTYSEIFPNEINYFHSLSQIENYYIFTDILKFDDEEIFFEKSYNIQYMYLILNNYINYYPKIFEVNEKVKNIFDNDIKYLRIIFLLFFYAFIIGNLFSLLLLYFTANLLDNKILNIIKKISEIENDQIIFLKKKLKLTKYLIKNEIKATKVLDSLKLISKDIKINQIKTNNGISSPKKTTIIRNVFNIDSKKENDLNDSFNNSKTNLLKRQDSINNFFKSNKKEENLYIEYSKQSPIKNLCFRNKNVLFIIIIFSFIFLLFIIIFTPLIISLINLNETKLFQILNINQFQTLILNYYFIIKYSILFNNSNIYENYTKIENVHNIYLYFSYIMTTLSNNYINVYNKINDYSLCEINNLSNDYEIMLKDICKFIPKLNTHLNIIVSGITKHLTEIYIEFLDTQRNFIDIQKYYHHKEIQNINYYFIISCINTMNYISNTYFIPDFLSKINYLTYFLILIYILMLFVEILNYYQTNYLLLKKLTKSYNNYEIIEKFFIEQKKNNKKMFL
jgi:hypothetical protein